MVQTRAQEYCEEVKRLPDSWRLFLQRTEESGYEGVRFWCLSALQEFVRARYATMDASQRLLVSLLV